VVTQESLPCTVQVPRLAKDCCVEEVRLYKCGACDDYLNLQEEIRFLKDGAHSSQLGPSKQDLRARLEARYVVISFTHTPRTWRD